MDKKDASFMLKIFKNTSGPFNIGLDKDNEIYIWDEDFTNIAFSQITYNEIDAIGAINDSDMIYLIESISETKTKTIEFGRKDDYLIVLNDDGKQIFRRKLLESTSSLYIDFGYSSKNYSLTNLKNYLNYALNSYDAKTFKDMPYVYIQESAIGMYLFSISAWDFSCFKINGEKLENRILRFEYDNLKSNIKNLPSSKTYEACICLSEDSFLIKTEFFIVQTIFEEIENLFFPIDKLINRDYNDWIRLESSTLKTFLNKMKGIYGALDGEFITFSNYEDSKVTMTVDKKNYEYQINASVSGDSISDIDVYAKNLKDINTKIDKDDDVIISFDVDNNAVKINDENENIICVLMDKREEL